MLLVLNMKLNQLFKSFTSLLKEIAIILNVKNSKFCLIGIHFGCEGTPCFEGMMCRLDCALNISQTTVWH